MGTPKRFWTHIFLCSLLFLSTLHVSEGQRLFTASEPAPAPAPLRSQRGVARPPVRPPVQAPAPRSGASRSAAATGPGPVPGRPAVVRLAAVRAPTPDGPALAQHAAGNRSAAAATAPAAAAENRTAAAATAPAAAATSATAGSSSTLFVVSAKSATVTQLGRGRNASVILEGVDPWATWFNDKPVHRGGRILSARLFGPDFMQDSTWMSNPDMALYSSGLAGTRDPVDRVMIITVGSNPNYSNFSDSYTVLASVTILSDGSLSFNDVTLGRRDSGEDTVAGYYSGVRGTLSDGPTVVNATALGRTRNIVFSNVAIFVETSQCGCNMLGTCGCQNATDAVSI
ncbi:hypothetical protein WJX75_008435 [Coccomyxa subellipsoidea]|uniref:Dirigent protein n=1 Tax=Coccomyxa subellipsoidea TaxID=248742 RepID=A0ABR2Z4Q7_9CHLO